MSPDPAVTEVQREATLLNLMSHRPSTITAGGESTRPQPRRQATMLAVLGFLIIAPMSFAGTIGFRTDTDMSGGPGVDAKVTLTHTGDEKAEQVNVNAEILGKSLDGEAVTSISPGQSHTWNIHLLDQVPNGNYVAALRIRYSDANGYPFEVLSVAPVTVGMKPAPRIFGSLNVPRLTVSGEATATLTAKRPPGRSGAFEARLVAPSGLTIAPERVILDFDPAGKAVADFRVRNSKLLAGTTVNIFAFITATDPEFPQTDTIRGNVRITTSSTPSVPPKFYQLGAALLLLLALLEAGAWAFARSKPGQ